MAETEARDRELCVIAIHLLVDHGVLRRAAGVSRAMNARHRKPDIGGPWLLRGVGNKPERDATDVNTTANLGKHVRLQQPGGVVCKEALIIGAQPKLCCGATRPAQHDFHVSRGTRTPLANEGVATRPALRNDGSLFREVDHLRVERRTLPGASIPECGLIPLGYGEVGHDGFRLLHSLLDGVNAEILVLRNVVCGSHSSGSDEDPTRPPRNHRLRADPACLRLVPG